MVRATMHEIVVGNTRLRVERDCTTGEHSYFVNDQPRDVNAYLAVTQAHLNHKTERCGLGAGIVGALQNPPLVLLDADDLSGCKMARRRDDVDDEMVRQMEIRRQARRERRRRVAPPANERRLRCSYCYQPGDHPAPAHCLRALDRR
jgi:hypothetical protein